MVHVRPLAAQRGWRYATGAVLALIVVGDGWYTTQVVVLDIAEPAVVRASVARASTPLPQDRVIQITATGAGVELQGTQLFRADMGPGTTRSAEQEVLVRLQSTGASGTWQLVSADGSPLPRSDGSYRLALGVAAPSPGCLLPRTDLINQQYPFATIASRSPTCPAPSSGSSAMTTVSDWWIGRPTRAMSLRRTRLMA